LTICIQETVARYRVGSPDSRVRGADSYPRGETSDAPELAQSAGGLDPLRPRAERGTSPQSHNSMVALHNAFGDRIISYPLRRVRSANLNKPCTMTVCVCVCVCVYVCVCVCGAKFQDSAIMHNTHTDRFRT